MSMLIHQVTIELLIGFGIVISVIKWPITAASNILTQIVDQVQQMTIGYARGVLEQVQAKAEEKK